MKPLPLLLAVLCAVLAGPALAQVKRVPDSAPAGGGEGPAKFDFTIRPKLFPHPVRPARDASKPMTVEEAKALSEDLFAAYQNIGALSRFRFHQRAKDQVPMTSDELGWVETELSDEMAAAEKLGPEAEKALKTGIERPAPWPEEFKKSLSGLKRMRMGGRALMARSSKPTYEHYRMFEQGAMGGIMRNLYILVDEAAAREDDPKEDAKFVAQTRQELSEDYAALASARKGMLDAAKESEARRKDEGARSGAARERAERAAGAGPKGGGAAKAAGKDGEAGVRDSGERITPEEAARRANAAELREANRKKGRSPAIVPAP